MRRAAVHVDVSACAEDSWLQTRDDDGANFRMLETDSLDGVSEFDIDAEVVRVELQFVAFGERLIFLDVH